MNTTSVECIETFEDFSRLRNCWNALLEGSDNDNPFMTHEWFSCWWKVFGEQARPFIFIVKKRRDCVAIAPLMVARVPWRKMPVRALMFLGQGHASRSGLILSGDDPRIAEAVFHAVVRKSSLYDLVWLDYIVKDSRTDRAAQALVKENGIQSVAMPSDRSPYIAVTREWDEYFGTRPSKLRRKISNMAHRIAIHGDMSVAMHRDVADTSVVNSILEVSRNSWKYNARSAIVSSSANEAFYRAVAAAAAEKGWLNLWLLLSGSRPVAFAFNLCYKEKVYAMQIGYDQRYRFLSPGEFLNYHAIRECFGTGRAEYDWLGKDEAFKLRWTSDLREHRRYYFFNDSFYGKGLYLTGRFIAPVAHCVRKAINKVKGAGAFHGGPDTLPH